MSTVSRYVGAALVGPACALALSGMLAPGPVSASPDQPIQVELGAHRFGALTPPTATVLTARPDQVGFLTPPVNPSAIGGPGSFQIAEDGRVWLLDQVKSRILIWPPGADRPSATVPLPDPTRDFAIGPDSTVYTLSASGTELSSLKLDGKARWRAPLALGADQDKLRTGPDGTLWLTGSEGTWTPVAAPGGTPIPVGEQIQRTQAQPLPGGGQLSVVWAPHNVTAGILDKDRRPVRAWYITSTTGVMGTSVLPAYVDGDPVVPLTVYEPGRSETLVLRLTASGAKPPVVLSRAFVGTTVTDIRVGPDKALYQMRVSAQTGVTISRYSLGFAATAPSPGSSAVPSVGPTAPASAPVAGTPAATPTALAPASTGHGRSWWPWLAALATAVLASVATVALVLWRRDRQILPEETGTEPPVTVGTGNPAP